MSRITSQLSGDGDQVTITVSGRFDFGLHDDFRNAYRDRAPGSVRYVVDMSSTEYMDSSALGMLLLLKEHAGGDRSRVTIRNANPAVDKILRIANFHKLFEITGSRGVAVAG